MKHQVRLLLADDHDVVRAGLRAVLEKHKGWTVCGEAANGDDAVKLTSELHPDVIVLDLEMNDWDGASVIRRIKQDQPRTEVLIFTMHDNDWLIRELLSAGAIGFVLKSEGVSSLIKAIESALQHKPFFPPRASETLLKSLRGSNGKRAIASSLTPRERQIVRLLANGSSNKEVAHSLGISTKTVETHRAAIMRKLGLNSIVSLVRYAVRERFIKA
jgi:DNA-binding NarL/FixJ family response regulator